MSTPLVKDEIDKMARFGNCSQADLIEKLQEIIDHCEGWIERLEQGEEN